MNNTETNVTFNLPNLINPIPFQENPPLERGIISYDKGRVFYTNEDDHVPGCLSRYNHPKYKDVHYEIKNIIENLIEEKLYPTYYFDRFYFVGQDLKKHRDRPSCEISVTLTLSHNADYDWPLWFELPDGTMHSSVTKPGDGILYLGVEIPHWREPLVGNSSTYWHQIFFHYVRSDGPYVHYAFDALNQRKR
jgi:hypothetical protein